MPIKTPSPLNSFGEHPLNWVQEARISQYHSVVLYVNQWFCFSQSISISIISLWFLNHQTLNHFENIRYDKNSQKVNENHCQTGETEKINPQRHGNINTESVYTKFHMPILNHHLASLTFTHYCSAVNG